MFFKKPSNPLPKIEDVLQPVVNIAPTPSVIIPKEIEYRPCYVNGRRALFHRWVNTANPVLPKGVEADDPKARFFQHRHTAGLVEYEDGTVERVWPQEIRFADSPGRFKGYEWETDGQRDEEKAK